MAKESIRFGIKGEDGRISLRWKCWIPKNVGKCDVYLSSRKMAHAFKTSLHESGDWRIRYDKNYYDKKIRDTSVGHEDGFINRWMKPPEICPGIILAIRIITPFASVNRPLIDEKETFWIPNARENGATETVILIDRYPERELNWADKKVIGSLSLDNGSIVWIAYHEIEMPVLPTMIEGKLHLFKGKSIKDLNSQSIRLLNHSPQKDGSMAFYDVAVIKKDGENYWLI